MLKNGGGIGLKLRVKLGCTPRYTPMVLKWCLAGQLAGIDFGRARAARRAKKFPFSPGAINSLFLSCTLSTLGRGGVADELRSPTPSPSPPATYTAREQDAHAGARSVPGRPCRVPPGPAVPVGGAVLPGGPAASDRPASPWAVEGRGMAVP